MKDDITISPYSNSPSTHGVERIDYGNVTIYKTSVGLMNNNVYLLVSSRGSDSSLLTDAAANAKHLIRPAEHVGTQVRAIVTTHSHGDHVQALDEPLQAFPVRHITFGLDAADIPKPADRQLNGGETITFGQNITLPTFILHGYTKDGLCLGLSAKAAGALSDGTLPHHLFVGGSIFPDGAGKTYSPEDFSQLIDDVKSHVFHVYPADSVIHPDHGKDTTVGVESPGMKG